jgi:hypothetical protein
VGLLAFERGQDVAPARRGVGRYGEVGILVEDPLGEAAQLRHRLHAELVGQDTADPPEGAQGVGLATEPVERQTGDAAFATVVGEGYWGTVSFVDYLSLAKIDGTWKIVNKLFAHTGGEPPGMG